MNPKIYSAVSVILLLFILTFTSCGSDDSGKLNVPDEIEINGTEKIHSETMKQLVSNTSTPIELSSMLKNDNIPFSKDYIANYSNIDEIISPNYSAINLGILGADLGYLNLYNKTSSVMTHLSDIKKLADNINVGHFFDFDRISKLAKGSENLDSLIYLSVSNFNDMDDYLRDNNKTNLSSLMITGVWIESTYLITEVYKNYPSDKLAEKIGEQKILLNDLVLVIYNYKDQSVFKELIEDFKKLKEIYENVEITETYENSEPVIVDGMMKVVQKSRSSVKINKRQINEINSEIHNIREKLIKGI
jgi:hypothetical protein